MELQKLELGPILGHTTGKSAKIWGKAPSGINGKTYLVARIVESGDSAISMWPVFDDGSFNEGAGVVEIEFDEDLLNEHNNKVKYEIGCVLFDGAASEFPFSEVDWDNSDYGYISLGHAGRSGINILLGSCRHCGVNDNYPRDGDTAFRTIANEHLNQIDFIMMTGDQVYADFNDGDSSHPNRGAKTKEEYFKKYEQAYSLENFKKVVRDKPTYMILDDHELWNDYYRYSDEVERRDPERFEAAISSYLAHQAILSPNTYPPNTLSVSQYPELDYKFEKGPYKFYVLDLRTKRNYGGATGPMMIDEDQEQDLINWINENKDHPYPKFIVSGIPVIPDFKGPFSQSTEKWGGFTEQRKRILDRITREGRFVFLSGDVHVSYVASLTRDGEDSPFVHNIVSSAFNWPQIGFQNWHFVWDKRLKEHQNDEPQEGDAGLVPEFYGPQRTFGEIVKTDNYAVLSAESNRIVVDYYKSNSGSQVGNSVVIEF